MPDPTYQDISLKDFEVALNTFLNKLEEQWRANRGLWQAFAEGILWEEDADDFNERIYDEVMSAVEQYGLSPEIVQALSPQAADVFNTVFAQRIRYDWELKNTEAMADYQQELANAAEKLWRLERDDAQFQIQQSNWERQFAREGEQAKKGDVLERIKLGQQQAQLMNEQELAASVRRAAAAQEMTQFLGQATSERERDIRFQEQQRFGQMFEAERSRLLGGTAPSDWFLREQAKYATNPFAQTEDVGAQIQQYREEAQTAKARVNEAASRFKALSSRVIDAADPIEGRELLMAKEQYDQAKQLFNELRAREESTKSVLVRAESSPEAQWAKPRSVAGGGMVVGAPEAPREKPKINIPTELTKAFGVSRFGQPIETPTLPQWSQATPTAQQQYLALLKAYGKDPAEIMRATFITPRSPSFRGRTVARQMT